MTLRTDAAAASIDYPLSAKATAPNIIKLDEEVFTQGGSKHPSEKTEEENLVASEDVGNEAAMEAVGRLIDEESLRAVGVIPQKPLYYRFIKRVFDIVFSTCVIIAGFIPGLILSAFIAKDTGGSPIYSSVRVGRGGKLFRIYKFRSMVADSDNLEKYFTRDQLELWHQEHKVDNDPRITKLGAFLRSSSIDEFPQFINVLLRPSGRRRSPATRRSCA